MAGLDVGENQAWNEDWEGQSQERVEQVEPVEQVEQGAASASEQQLEKS